MEQYVIGEIEEAIFYLIVFVSCICIILHYYVLPSIKRAMSLDDLPRDPDKLPKRRPE